MSKSIKRFVAFRSIPNGTVFKVAKETSRVRKAVPGHPAVVPVPPSGMFVKIGNSRSRAYSKAKEIVLALGDIVEVIAYPSQKHEMHLS